MGAVIIPRLPSLHERSPNATGHPGFSEGDERTRTAGGGFADPWLNHLPTSPKSGRRDSNPRRPAWEAGILPLNYSRIQFPQPYSTERRAACQARAKAPLAATRTRAILAG